MPPKKYKKHIIKHCEMCGKEFKTYFARIRQNKGKFCSKECAYLKRKDYPAWNKGTSGVMEANYQSFESGHIPWNKGIKGLHLSPKTEYKKGRARPKDEVIKSIKNHSKEKHWNWKGGKTSLYNQIRHLKKYEHWRTSIFKKYNYMCQICGKTGRGLQVHHNIKEFSIILKDFLEVYSNLSLIENKEELLALACKYKPFWDKDNGVVLCVECHYKQRGKKWIERVLR